MRLQQQTVLAMFLHTGRGKGKKRLTDAFDKFVSCFDGQK